MLIYSGSHPAPVLPAVHNTGGGNGGHGGGNPAGPGAQAPVRYDDTAVTQAVNQMADKADWDGVAQVSLLVQQSDAQQWERLRANVEQRLHEQMQQHFKADDHEGRGQAIAHVARADSTLAKNLYQRYEPQLKDDQRDDMARGFYRGLGSEGMNRQARTGDGRWLLERTKYNLSDKSDGVSDEEKRYTQVLDDKLSTIHLGDKAPPPPKEGEEPEKPRYSDQDAREDAIKLYKATKGDGGSFLGMTMPGSGWGTDEDAVWKVLKPRTTDDIAKIRAAYHDEYNRDLDADMQDEMSGEDLQHVKALLKGGKLEGDGSTSRNAESDAVEIHAELHGIFGNNDRVLNLLQKAPAEHRQAIAEAYAKKYGDGQSGEGARKFLLSECEDEGGIGGDKLLQVKGLLAGDTPPTQGGQGQAQPGGMTDGETSAAAARLHQALYPHAGYTGRGGAVPASADADKVLGALRDAGNGDNLARIGAAYQKQYGTSLQEALDKGLHGADRDEALQLLRAPTVKADDKTKADWAAGDSATRVHKAIDGWGTDEDGLRNALKGKSGEEVKAIALAYFDRYASDDQKRDAGANRQQAAMDLIRKDIGDDLSGAEKTEILQYLDAPAAKDAPGWQQWQADHDAARLKLAMDGMGTDEGMIRETLQGKTKPEIDAITASYQKQFGGDLRHRLDDELDGRDTIELLEQDYDVGAVDMSDKRVAASEILQRNQQRLDYENDGGWHFQDGDLAQQDIDRARQALKDGNLDRGLELANTSGVHVDNLIASKDAATNLAAEAAVLVVTLPVVALSGGTLAPVEAVIVGAFAGAAAAGTVYGTLDPQVGGHEILRHALIGAAEGATAGVPIGRLGQAGKEAVAASRAARAAKAARAGLAHDAPDAVVQAADKQLDKALRLADRKAKVYARVQRMGGAPVTLRDSTVWGAGGGAAYGITDSATQHQTWSHGFGTGVLTVLKQGGTSALTGVAMGVPLGMGFHGAVRFTKVSAQAVQRWRGGGGEGGSATPVGGGTPPDDGGGGGAQPTGHDDNDGGPRVQRTGSGSGTNRAANNTSTSTRRSGETGRTGRRSTGTTETRTTETRTGDNAAPRSTHEPVRAASADPTPAQAARPAGPAHPVRPAVTSARPAASRPRLRTAGTSDAAALAAFQPLPVQSPGEANLFFGTPEPAATVGAKGVRDTRTRATDEQRRATPPLQQAARATPARGRDGALPAASGSKPGAAADNVQPLHADGPPPVPAENPDAPLAEVIPLHGATQPPGPATPAAARTPQVDVLKLAAGGEDLHPRAPQASSPFKPVLLRTGDSPRASAGGDGPVQGPVEGPTPSPGERPSPSSSEAPPPRETPKQAKERRLAEVDAARRSALADLPQQVGDAVREARARLEAELQTIAEDVRRRVTERATTARGTGEAAVDAEATGAIATRAKQEIGDAAQRLQGDATAAVDSRVGHIQPAALGRFDGAVAGLQQHAEAAVNAAAKRAGGGGARHVEQAATRAREAAAARAQAEADDLVAWARNHLHQHADGLERSLDDDIGEATQRAVAKAQAAVGREIDRAVADAKATVADAVRRALNDAHTALDQSLDGLRPAQARRAQQAGDQQVTQAVQAVNAGARAQVTGAGAVAGPRSQRAIDEVSQALQKQLAPEVTAAAQAVTPAATAAGDAARARLQSEADRLLQDAHDAIDGLARTGPARDAEAQVRAATATHAGDTRQAVGQAATQQQRLAADDLVRRTDELIDRLRQHIEAEVRTSADTAGQRALLVADVPGLNAARQVLPPETLRQKRWRDVAKAMPEIIAIHYKSVRTGGPGRLRPSANEKAMLEYGRSAPAPGEQVRFFVSLKGRYDPARAVYGPALPTKRGPIAGLRRTSRLGGGTGLKGKRLASFDTFEKAAAYARKNGGGWVHRAEKSASFKPELHQRRWVSPKEIVVSMHVNGRGEVLPIAVPNVHAESWGKRLGGRDKMLVDPASGPWPKELAPPSGYVRDEHSGLLEPDNAAPAAKPAQSKKHAAVTLVAASAPLAAGIAATHFGLPRLMGEIGIHITPREWLYMGVGAFTYRAFVGSTKAAWKNALVNRLRELEDPGLPPQLRNQFLKEVHDRMTGASGAMRGIPKTAREQIAAMKPIFSDPAYAHLAPFMLDQLKGHAGSLLSHKSVVGRVQDSLRLGSFMLTGERNVQTLVNADIFPPQTLPVILARHVFGAGGSVAGWLATGAKYMLEYVPGLKRATANNFVKSLPPASSLGDALSLAPYMLVDGQKVAHYLSMGDPLQAGIAGGLVAGEAWLTRMLAQDAIEDFRGVAQRPSKRYVIPPLLMLGAGAGLYAAGAVALDVIPDKDKKGVVPPPAGQLPDDTSSPSPSPSGSASTSGAPPGATPGATPDASATPPASPGAQPSHSPSPSHTAKPTHSPSPAPTHKTGPRPVANPALSQFINVGGRRAA